MTTIAAARALLISEGYAPEDVAGAIDSLISAGLETPVAEQDGDSTDDLVIDAYEVDILRDQIVSQRGVTVAEITAALRAEGIDYRVEHPGTIDASVHVGDLAMGPTARDQDSNGLGVDSYDGDSQDWHPTIADAVARARKYVTAQS